MNSWFCFLNPGLPLLALGLSLCISAAPVQAEGPFVAGYDRFFSGPTRVDSGKEAQEKATSPHLGAELLVSELSCTACHQTEQSRWLPKKGPNLAGAGNRLQQEWLISFLTSPAKTKPGSTMPELLAGLSAQERTEAATALAAFLQTRQTPFPELKSTGANPIAYEFWKKGEQSRGQELYHRIGCVACHAPDPDYAGGSSQVSPLEQLLAQLEPEEIEEMGLLQAVTPVNPVPHSQLARKYSLLSLTFFLLNPETTHTSGRMPNFQLNPQDAADLSAYLLHRENEAPLAEIPAENPEENSSLVKQGRELFVSLNCAQCHTLEGISTPVQFPAFSAVAQRLEKAAATGDAVNPCWSTSVDSSRFAAGQPDYLLSPQQQTELTELLKQLARQPESLALSPADSLHLQLLQLNCYACHERGQKGGVGGQLRKYFETKNHIDIGDEGRFPPHLDGVGQKLNADWLKKVFQGQGHIRPFLYARMPVFPGHATNPLTQQLRQVDQNRTAFEKAEWSQLKPTAELLEAGRQLLDTGCVQCHAVQGEALPGVVGVDLATISQRVSPEWFQHFLKDPAALKPRTRMPTFFPGGKSSNQEILDGDMEQQIAALWMYLKNSGNQPLPQKILTARSESYELKPGDHPIVLRTFMVQAGTHAVAVGYPEGLNLAYDSELMRLAIAWPGRFLDAYGTWFVRFAPPAEPLSEAIVTFPAGVPLARLETSEANWPENNAALADYQFLGYRLTSTGRPVFLYRFENYLLEEELEPVSPQRLKRHLRIRQADKTPQQLSSENSSGEKAATGKIWFRLATEALPEITQENQENSEDKTSRTRFSTSKKLSILLPEELAREAHFRKAQAEWLLPFILESTEVDGQIGEQSEKKWTIEYRW